MTGRIQKEGHHDAFSHQGPLVQNRRRIIYLIVVILQVTLLTLATMLGTLHLLLRLEFAGHEMGQVRIRVMGMTGPESISHCRETNELGVRY